MVTLIYILFAIVGLCVGSFLNVVIYRVPNQMSIAFPASHCPKCEKPIKWYDNIPLLSFLFLGAKCRYCKQPISPRYFFVELLTALCYVGIAVVFYKISVTKTLLYIVIVSCLVCVAFIDFDTKTIPLRFTAVIAVCGIFLAIYNAVGGIYWENLLGLAVGFGVPALLYFGALLLLKKEAMGFGDCLLLGAVGLALGWRNVFLTLLLGSVAASVCLIIISVRAKGEAKGREYPFAPFLCAAAVIAMIFGDIIINAYLGMFL